MPNSQSRLPPYFFGIFAGSIKVESVRYVFSSVRMKIFDVVIGSNHLLIQPQTVGKNEGAPMI